MRYRCLVLDHDDTVVNSTFQVHYPTFVEFLKITRPGMFITFAEYMEENSSPGFLEMCTNRFAFTEEEMQEEVNFWERYVKKHIPTAYGGLSGILTKYKKAGGIICVVSHSLSENILRDYEANGLPRPDAVYGWESPREERKPSPYALLQIMKKYKLNPSEILVVDDLKPGYDMAKSCSIDFAAAGWAYELPQIENFMRANSDYYLKTVEELKKVIF